MPDPEQSVDSGAGADVGRASGDAFSGAFLRLFRAGQRAVPGPPPLALTGVGVALVALAIGQAFVASGGLRHDLLGTVLPGSASVVVLAAGWWTTGVDRSREKHASAVVTGVTFMAISVGTVGLVLLVQRSAVTAAFDWPFTVATTLSVGAAVGAPTGFALDEVLARQEALDAEYRETKRLNQRLQVLNRVLRHNVRNELNVALGGLEMADPYVAPEGQEWLARAERALDRLSSHTEKIVRLDATDWSEADRTTVDLAAALADLTERLPTDRCAGTVEVHLPDRARVCAHPLVGQAVVEAVDNALQHSPDDVAVTVRVTAADAHVEVVVADTGPGLPRMDRQTLAAGEERPLRHGRGVGLWFVTWVVEASGGTVSFEENDPSGTVVRFCLPRTA
ncbi:MAG: sensor histidine kinase [Haloarculaceae archaeon]